MSKSTHLNSTDHAHKDLSIMFADNENSSNRPASRYNQHSQGDL